MPTRILYFVHVLALFLASAYGQTATTAPYLGMPTAKSTVVNRYGSLPLIFEPNQGQTDPQVKFVSRGKGYCLTLTTTEAVLTLRSASRHQSTSARLITAMQEENSAVIRMTLIGADAAGVQVFGNDELPGKSNYFIGNDSKKWRTNVRQYAKVRYANLYPAVDLVFYGNQRELEY